jgi:hypothetical protein
MMQVGIAYAIGSSWMDWSFTTKQESPFCRWVFVIRAPAKTKAIYRLDPSARRFGMSVCSSTFPTLR